MGPFMFRNDLLTTFVSRSKIDASLTAIARERPRADAHIPDLHLITRHCFQCSTRLYHLLNSIYNESDRQIETAGEMVPEPLAVGQIGAGVGAGIEVVGLVPTGAQQASRKTSAMKAMVPAKRWIRYTLAEMKTSFFTCPLPNIIWRRGSMRSRQPEAEDQSIPAR